MEQSYSAANASPVQVSVKPDKEEKKQIRIRYFKVGLVILFNMIMFNFIITGAAYIIIGLAGGGEFTLSSIKDTARRILAENPDISVIVSCAIPIISEVLSILLGCRLLKLKLRSLFTRSGYTGGTVVKTSSIGLGIQTGAALIAQIVAAILAKFNLKSATADLTIHDNAAWSVIIMYFYACLLGPLLEELLYRGVILQGMRKYNERFAIVISALIFGLMHQNYQQFILAFALGLVLAAVTLKYESIVPAVITHIIVNTTGILTTLVLQCTDYGAYQKVAEGSVYIPSAEPGFMVALAFNALFRYGFLIAGLILLILALVKKNNVRKPTPAGKSRSWPVLAQSIIWYVILIAYIYLVFVAPMQKIG